MYDGFVRVFGMNDTIPSFFKFMCHIYLYCIHASLVIIS